MCICDKLLIQIWIKFELGLIQIWMKYYVKIGFRFEWEMTPTDWLSEKGTLLTPERYVKQRGLSSQGF